MADPPRAPLVVIPEASWFPTAFAAPWVRRDALGAESSVTSSDVQDRGVLHSQTCPVLPLPRPVVVLNTDDTTSSALETSRRDHDSEIAAHPDFLRTLGWMHGDVVEVTEHVGGETRVGRIVAATRWEEDGGAGKGVDEAEDGEDDLDAEASAACDETERNTYEASSKSLLLTNKLYLPPAMRRNLKLHVHFALQDAVAKLGAEGETERESAASRVSFGGQSTSGTSDSDVFVRVTRRTTPAPVAKRVAIAPVRALRCDWFGDTGDRKEENDVWANSRNVDAAVSAYFHAERWLAVGDVFAVRVLSTADASVVARGGVGDACAAGKRFGVKGTTADDARTTTDDTNKDIEAFDTTVTKRPYVKHNVTFVHFVVVSLDTDEVDDGNGTNAKDDRESVPRNKERRGAKKNVSHRVSRKLTACAVTAPVGNGSVCAEMERFVLGGTVRTTGSEDGLFSVNAHTESRDTGRTDAFSLNAHTDALLDSSAAVCELVRAVAPAAHAATSARYKLQVAAALCGAPGFGKRWIAKQTAAQLGCSFLSVNCCELVAESAEGKVFQKLERAFVQAAKCGPCVLYLRRFEVFANFNGGSGGNSGVAVGNSHGTRVAGLLKRLIKAHSGWRTAGGAPRNAAGDDTRDVFSSSSPGHSSVLNAALNPSVTLVVGADDVDAIPFAVRACLTHEISVTPLREGKRLDMLKKELQGLGVVGNDSRLGASNDSALSLKNDGHTDPLTDSLDFAAAATSGATPREMLGLVNRAKHEFLVQSRSADLGDRGITDHTSVSNLKPQHVDAALRWSETRVNTKFGAPTVPTTTWGDVGGLEEVKAAILSVVERPLKRARELTKILAREFESEADTAPKSNANVTAAFTLKLKSQTNRSGVLLYGPPGTGKTLLAKAVATECSLRFLSVKGPELINMYVGESEKNVRDVFAKARGAAPCVIFFDELDALAPARGNTNDGGGVMDRVVSSLLAELDGAGGVNFNFGGNRPGADQVAEMVFVIGATNRPDLVDPSLLRPGRFDTLLYVGVDVSLDGRFRVLQALTRKFIFLREAGDEDSETKTADMLRAVAQKVPPKFTGADLYALCADAWMRAAKRAVQARGGLGGGGTDVATDRESLKGKTEKGDGAKVKPDSVLVVADDFFQALGSLTPSLSDEEVSRYVQMREDFEGSRGGANLG